MDYLQGDYSKLNTSIEWIQQRICSHLQNSQFKKQRILPPEILLKHFSEVKSLEDIGD